MFHVSRLHSLSSSSLVTLIHFLNVEDHSSLSDYKINIIIFTLNCGCFRAFLANIISYFVRYIQLPNPLTIKMLFVWSLVSKNFIRFISISVPLVIAEATGDYKSRKSDHISFEAGSRIKVFGKYISQPYNRLWEGEVIGAEVKSFATHAIFYPQLFSLLISVLHIF